jgi:nitroreductase
MSLADPARTLAIEARYGAQPRPGTVQWNDTIATILAHRSVRSYKTDPLPEGTVETLVAAAQSAASSSNLQYWSVIAVTDRAVKSKLAVLAGNQRHIDEAPLLLLFVADFARTHNVGERAKAPTEGLDYLDSLLVGAVDAGLAAQNAVIAAESLGLGTVYIGALRNRALEVGEAVGLPPRTTVVFGLVVGWPDPERPAAVKPRLPQSVVLHHDHYDATDPVAAIEGYDQVSRDFQAAEGLPSSGWIAPLLARSAGPAALNGRDKLRDAYLAQQISLL